jgi:hypothetical protein
VLGRERIPLTPNIIAVILRTLKAGWAEASRHAEVRSSAGEVQMTERLRDGMRSVLNSGRLPWSKSFIVAPGSESRSTLSILEPDGRTDIPLYIIEVFLRYAEHDPHAIIECKRLTPHDTHLCREYVVEGVDRFRTGKYGENHAVGFMAAYLLVGSPATGAGGINAYLSRVGRAMESLAPSDAVGDAAFWRSTHLRTIPRDPISLHHALLQVPAPTC